MAGKEACSAAVKAARPLLSTSHTEAKTRVLGLYKACYRNIPFILQKFDVPKNEQQIRCKIRELFYKNACITDIRIIDMLVLKGYMELKEVTEVWQQKGWLMHHWRPTYEPKPTTFLAKFLNGLD